MCGYVAAYVHSFCMLFCVERHVDISTCLSTQNKCISWTVTRSFLITLVFSCSCHFTNDSFNRRATGWNLVRHLVILFWNRYHREIKIRPFSHLKVLMCPQNFRAVSCKRVNAVSVTFILGYSGVPPWAAMTRFVTRTQSLWTKFFLCQLVYNLRPK
jgi:hypothetical protein